MNRIIYKRVPLQSSVNAVDSSIVGLKSLLKELFAAAKKLESCHKIIRT